MLNKDLILLNDAQGEFRGNLDPDTGKVYGKDGRLLYSMARDTEREYHLAEQAAMYDAAGIVAQTKKSVTLRDRSWASKTNPEGARIITMSDPDVVRLLAGNAGDLAPADVHLPRGLPNYAAGYSLAGGVADIVSPPFLAPNQQDKYWTWSSNNQFQPAQPNTAGAGGSPNEINPTLSNSPFITVPFALGSFIPTEVQSNADAPLQPMSAAVRMVVDKLKLARELRVAALHQTSGSFNSNLVLSQPAANKWNGGASSDPIADIHLIQEQSFMDVTRIVMSRLAYHDFVRNPQVQKYFYAKAGYAPMPLDGGQLAQTLGIPPITVADIKYQPTQAGGATYVWGNHVCFLHEATALSSGQDVATGRTFRWQAGTTPDSGAASGGQAVGGWLVRTYFDPKRGPRGGTVVVVSHWDVEIITSSLVGGLISNAHQ